MFTKEPWEGSGTRNNKLVFVFDRVVSGNSSDRMLLNMEAFPKTACKFEAGQLDLWLEISQSPPMVVTRQDLRAV